MSTQLSKGDKKTGVTTVPANQPVSPPQEAKRVSIVTNVDKPTKPALDNCAVNTTDNLDPRLSLEV